MSIAISDALQQAEQAIQGGDHRAAIQTCSQLVARFPDYAAAYRVLGEAYLGQGRVSEAEQAFAQVLTRDPRQPLAYHGLGLIAERQEVLDHALAFCQVAWELAPNQPKLREPVIRIASRQFGSEGQAQLTSAALAQIYASTYRYQRAVNEFRGALADLPERVDLKLGLAETLWQLGRDDEAAGLCREILEDHPVAIQALVILAEISGRTGDAGETESLLSRIRAIDPDGSITSSMLARNDRAKADGLVVAAEEIPHLEPVDEPVVVERPQIAPAPDFTYQPARAELMVQDFEELEPITAEELGGEPVAADTFAEADSGYDEEILSVFRSVEDEALIATTPDEPAQAATDVDEAIVDDLPGLASLDEDDLGDFDDLLAEFGDVEPMGLEEFGAEPEDLERLAATGQELLADNDLFADLAATPVDTSGENEHVRSLASALEADVAGVLDRTGQFPVVTPEQEAEPVEADPAPADLDFELEEEPPAVDPLSGTGYTTVLRELGDEGYTPFDPLGRPDVAAERDETDDAIDELASLTEDWDSIDDEISQAVPVSTGHTDQLLAADDFGVEPFDFEIEDDTSRLPAYRPYGENDNELPELAETAADVEAVAEVTPEPDVTTEATPEAAMPDIGTIPADLPLDDTFEDLEPFSLAEFEEDVPQEPSRFGFGRLPWETDEGESELDASDDLELLLTPEDLALADQPTQVLDSAAGTVEHEPEVEADADAKPVEDPAGWIASLQEEPAEEVNTIPQPDITEPYPSWNMPDDWDTSLAVTRQIGDGSDDPLAHLTAEDDDRGSTVDLAPLGETDPETLAADADIFERARAGKTDLIDQGMIEGDRDLVEQESGAEEAEDVLVEQVEEPAGEDAADISEPDTMEDFVVSTGASRDVATLRASLEVAPEDDELHWWLAEALRERGDIDDAYTEYRWLIRNAPHRGDAVIESIQMCIEDDRYAEVGHRLLGDLYRRRGQTSLASSHAAAAMAVRRRLRG
jgi:tetratricopeptide (TPR) repeat protein